MKNKRLLISFFVTIAAIAAIASTYNTVPSILLKPSGAVQVFNAEAVTTGEGSQQVQLLQKGNDTVPSLSVEILFSGAPGTFSIAVQEANTDTAGAYQTISACTATTANASNYARIDCPAIHANFARVFVTAQPSNVVNTSATITR